MCFQQNIILKYFYQWNKYISNCFIVKFDCENTAVMRYILPLTFFLCMVGCAKAQNVDFYGKELAKDICNQYGMKDDQAAKDCLDKICDAADIPNNFVLAPCTGIDNCFALYKNGYSYIVYDINFFNKIKTYGFTEKNLQKNTVDWAALTILAHELGHHMCLHTTNPNLSSIYTPVQIELQADEYAGSVMYKLGATLIQAQLAMNSSDVPEEGSLTHPGRKPRLAAIAKGWNKEYKKDMDKNRVGNNTNQAPPDIPTSNTVTNTPATNKTAVITPNKSVVPPSRVSSNPAVTNRVANNDPAPATHGDVPGMVFVRGGSFNMGSNDGENDERPMHRVTVGSFYMSKYLVTVGEYRKFAQATGYGAATVEKEVKTSRFARHKPDPKPVANWEYDASGNKRGSNDDNEPVIYISWDDCIRYCEWMSGQTGKTYRLPTEAEWEYATRGGGNGGSYAYSGSNDLDEVAWYSGNSANRTQPVGQKKPNELGLYDMIGNVRQWCNDWYDPNYYGSSPTQNPQGATTGVNRVVRGSSWHDASQYCRPSYRISFSSDSRFNYIGFRPVISN